MDIENIFKSVSCLIKKSLKMIFESNISTFEEKKDVYIMIELQIVLPTFLNFILLESSIKRFVQFLGDDRVGLNHKLH